MVTSLVRIGLLQLQGVLDRLGAAVAAAVGPLGVPGADALDHDDALCRQDPGVLFGDQLFQLPLGDHLRGRALEVLFVLQLVGARRDDHDAVLDGLLAFPWRRPWSCSCR